MITDFRLHVFRTVAQRLSFTKAAGELFISQPAVTKHINELEKQLGSPLFIRQSNKIQLTPKGELLLQHAGKILGLYQQLNEELASSNELTGSFKLGASTTIAQYVLPALLASFKRRYEHVNTTLFSGNSEQIEQLLLSGSADFGLIEGDATVPSLHYEPFMNDEVVLLTSPNNPQFASGELGIADLPTIPLVVREYGSGTLDVLTHALEKQHIDKQQLKIEMQLGSSESIKRYLEFSNAFAFMSIAAVRTELQNGTLRMVNVRGLTVNRTFRFVSVHGQYSRIVELFKQLCLSSHSL